MWRSSLLLLLAGGLLAGCGGGDAQEGRAVIIDPGETLRVIADEYSFDPARITLTGPGTLRLELRNEGSLAHNLKVQRGGRELGGTPTFEGGQTRTAAVRVSRGSYDLVCTVGDHAELGMTGTLEVR